MRSVRPGGPTEARPADRQSVLLLKATVSETDVLNTGFGSRTGPFTLTSASQNRIGPAIERTACATAASLTSNRAAP
jgi:hypothetical protein